MSFKGKKLINLFLVISLLIFSMTLTAKERRGSEVVVHFKDGQQVRGELIAVKQNSLLLKESEKGTDVSVEVSEIKVIIIVKKSKAVTGAIVGGVVGVIGGVALGYASEYSEYGEIAHPSTLVKAGLFLGAVCAIAGMLVGIPLGIDQTVQIEGKTDPDINKLLEDLRKKARVTEFQ
jgi:hypothetical protein